MKLLLSALLFSFAVSTAAYAEPKIVIAPSSYNFGKLDEGDKADKVFTITNSGSSQLTIRRIKTSCGCTASKLEKKSLKPNESTQLTISYDTKNRPGIFNKTVTIFSDSATNPDSIVSIKGFVIGLPKPHLEVKPNPVAVGQVAVGKERVVRFTVKNRGDAKLIISKIKLLDSRRQQIETVSTDEIMLQPEESKKMETSISPEKEGTVRFYIEFSTNNPVTPKDYVIIYGSSS